jgi:hypothetical protein
VLRNGEFWIGGNGNRMLVDAHGAKARVGEILSFHGTIVRNARPVAGSTVRVVASGLRGR